MYSRVEEDVITGVEKEQKIRNKTVYFWHALNCCCSETVVGQPVKVQLTAASVLVDLNVGVDLDAVTR